MEPEEGGTGVNKAIAVDAPLWRRLWAIYRGWRARHVPLS